MNKCFKAAILCRPAAPEFLALQMNLRPARHNPGSGIIEEIRRPLGVACCGEDRAVVSLEDLQPVGQVSGVVLTRLQRKVKISAEKSGSEFGHEFLHSVAIRAETFAAEVTCQSQFMRSPVTTFMSEGRVKRLGVLERLDGRHDDAVGRRPVEGAAAAV